MTTKQHWGNAVRQHWIISGSHHYTWSGHHVTYVYYKQQVGEETFRELNRLYVGDVRFDDAADLPCPANWIIT